jgi:hypothetical protein
MIVECIREHGTPIHVEKEFHIKPMRCRKDVCYYGDILAVYEKGKRWYLVGIEIKDWKATVGPGLALEYLSAYGNVCEYFYLAARRFSNRLLRVPSIGLFSLEKMEVVKKPKYLYPNEKLRANAVNRMKKSGLDVRVIESPYQTTLDMFL